MLESTPQKVIRHMLNKNEQKRIRRKRRNDLIDDIAFIVICSIVIALSVDIIMQLWIDFKSN